MLQFGLRQKHRVAGNVSDQQKASLSHSPASRDDPKYGQPSRRLCEDDNAET